MPKNSRDSCINIWHVVPNFLQLPTDNRPALDGAHGDQANPALGKI